MTTARAWYRIALLAGFALFMREIVDASQQSARVIEEEAGKAALKIRDAVTFAREMDDAGVRPQDRQLVMNAYMRGMREGADRG